MTYPWHLSRGRAGFWAVFRIRWRGGCGSHRNRVVISYKIKYKTCRWDYKKFEFSVIFIPRLSIGISNSPEDPLVLFSVFGFLFLVWIPSFFMASGRGTCRFDHFLIYYFDLWCPLTSKTYIEFESNINGRLHSPRVALCRAHTRYTPALPPRFCATKWSCWSDS